MVIFKKIKLKREYTKAFSDTFLLLILTVMPTLFGLVFSYFGIISKPISSLYDKGDLFLYSISFLGSAYIIYKQLNNDLFKVFGNLFVGFLFLISFFYSAAAISSENKHVYFILITSIVTLVISFPFLYHSQVLSNKEQPPDVSEYRNDEQTIIENSLS